MTLAIIQAPTVQRLNPKRALNSAWFAGERSCSYGISYKCLEEDLRCFALANPQSRSSRLEGRRQRRWQVPKSSRP